MTTFPDWTGPEAVRRLNAFKALTEYHWPQDGTSVHVRALQQLMVDLNMQPPKDEAEEITDNIMRFLEGNNFSLRRVSVCNYIRAALAKAAGA